MNKCLYMCIWNTKGAGLNAERYKALKLRAYLSRPQGLALNKPIADPDQLQILKSRTWQDPERRSNNKNTHGGPGLKGPPMGAIGRIIPPRIGPPRPLMFLYLHKGETFDSECITIKINKITGKMSYGWSLFAHINIYSQNRENSADTRDGFFVSTALCIV